MCWQQKAILIMNFQHFQLTENFIILLQHFFLAFGLLSIKLFGRETPPEQLCCSSQINNGQLPTRFTNNTPVAA